MKYYFCFYNIKCILLPIIFKFDKSKWRTSSIFQVDEGNLPILVEQILDVLAPDVWRQVPDVYSGLGTARHSCLLAENNGEREIGFFITCLVFQSYCAIRRESRLQQFWWCRVTIQLLIRPVSGGPGHTCVL